jgi:hypothetical protein
MIAVQNEWVRSEIVESDKEWRCANGKKNATGVSVKFFDGTQKLNTRINAQREV